MNPASRRLATNGTSRSFDRLRRELPAWLQRIALRLWRPRVVDAVLGVAVVGCTLAALAATWVGVSNAGQQRAAAAITQIAAIH